MSDGADVVEQLRRAIVARIREQATRHLQVSPTTSKAQIIDIQIRQEEERLIKLADESGDNLAEVYDAIREWLPELAAELKRGSLS